MVPEISVQELAVRWDEFTVLDVREPEEQAVARLTGTLDIPMGEIGDRLAEIPRDRPLAVMCHHGGRSLRAAKYLAQVGFANVANVVGGIDAWSENVDPKVPTY